MAQKLTTFDFTKPSSLTNTDRRAYPWEEWLDGNIWEIKYGEDFTAHPLMMERIIRTRATAKHAKVQLRHQALNGDNSGIIVLRRSDIAQPKPPRVRKAANKPVVLTDITPKVAAKKAAAKAVIGDTTKVTKKVTPAKAAAKKAAPTKKVASKKAATSKK